MEIKDLIAKSGLDETEAKVYLALLELGPATVSDVTKKAQITRTLGYHILEKLGHYGLVDRASSSGKKIIFTALHPNRLIQFVKNKKNKWQRALTEVENNISELVNIYRVAEKPVIRYSSGADGLKNLFLETLDSKTEILSILDIEGWATTDFKEYAREYNCERAKKKLMEKILVLDNKIGRDWMANFQGSFKYTNYRWIKPEILPNIKNFGGEINIYENKVAIVIFKPAPMCIIIESSVLADILRSLHHLAWNSGIEIK
ncbi:MAG: helix-turn-helix domain-containing protein [Patescibacteria group bacterium]